MFGSAGSVIASPGQGNYAAANAFLDVFAHYRLRPGVTGTHNRLGPMVSGDGRRTQAGENLRAAGNRAHHACGGTRILDRLINQKVSNVVAISVDWMRARRAGLGGRLPPIFSELGTAEISPDTVDSDSSVFDFLSGCPKAERLDAVAGLVQQIAAAVFEIAAADIGPDDSLDDIGLD